MARAEPVPEWLALRIPCWDPTCASLLLDSPALFSDGGSMLSRFASVREVRLTARSEPHVSGVDRWNVYVWIRVEDPADAPSLKMALAGRLIELGFSGVTASAPIEPLPLAECVWTRGVGALLLPTFSDEEITRILDAAPTRTSVEILATALARIERHIELVFRLATLSSKHALVLALPSLAARVRRIATAQGWLTVETDDAAARRRRAARPRAVRRPAKDAPALE